MRNNFAKFINSFPGMTIWMFTIQFAISAFIFNYSIIYSLTMSSTLSVFLAWQFSRRTKRDMPFFTKNVEENRFDLMRRFKKYVQKGELPADKNEYAKFMAYLEEAEKNHAKKSLKQEKTIVLILGTLGVLILWVDSVISGAFFITLTIFFALQIRVSANARKMVPLLKEKLQQEIEGVVIAQESNQS